MKVSTKFNVGMTIRCLVRALLLLIRYVTLWPWPLTFWPWSVVIHGGSRGQPIHQVWRYYGYPFLSYEFWHLPQDAIDNAFAATVHASYHVWPMRIGGSFPAYSKPRFAYSLYNLCGATIKTNGVIRQNSVWLCAKDHTALCACAKSRQHWTLP